MEEKNFAPEEENTLSTAGTQVCQSNRSAADENYIRIRYVLVYKANFLTTSLDFLNRYPDIPLRVTT